MSESPLDDASLARLAGALAELKGRELSRGRLARLTEVAPAGVDLTIDLSSQALLGQPLVVARVRSVPGSDPCFRALTPREREVAALLAAGLRNADVAMALGLALSTVKDHVHRILHKSGLDGRSQVAAVWNTP